MTSTPNNNPNEEQGITPAPEPSEDRDSVNAYQDLLKVLFEKKDIDSRSILVNPSAIESLAQHSPDALIKFAESSDERQYQFHLKLQEQQHKENLAKESTSRWILGGIFGLFTICFIYAAYTKDQSLPTQVFNVLLGGAGGAGLITTLNRKKD